MKSFVLYWNAIHQFRQHERFDRAHYELMQRTKLVIITRVHHALMQREKIYTLHQRCCWVAIHWQVKASQWKVVGINMQRVHRRMQRCRIEWSFNNHSGTKSCFKRLLSWLAERWRCMYECAVHQTQFTETCGRLWLMQRVRIRQGSTELALGAICDWCSEYEFGRQRNSSSSVLDLASANWQAQWSDCSIPVLSTQPKSERPS